eukprot:4517257-Pyramimonas_sp.AAC.1
MVMVRLTVCHPRLSERLWIDDLSQTAVGSRASACNDLVESITCTSDLMDEYSLRLAKKSTITYSDMRGARRIQKRLQAR